VSKFDRISKTNFRCQKDNRAIKILWRLTIEKIVYNVDIKRELKQLEQDWKVRNNTFK